MIELINCDAIGYMATLNDNEKDLGIVDPEYGINRAGQVETFTKNPKHKRKYFADKGWDNEIPDELYFNELFRVTKNQIIWGGNYFAKYLPSSMGWIFWDKGQDLSMSDGELAFTSFERALRRVTINRGQLMLEGGTIHPTQKPIKLYKWLLKNYAQKGDKILDTHGGSFSHAIAAYDLGFDLTIMEIDEDYYKAGKERFDAHVAKYSPASEIPVTKKGELKLF